VSIDRHLIRENQLLSFNTSYLIISYLSPFYTLNTLKISNASIDSATEIYTVRILVTKVTKPNLYYGDCSKLEE
jgi:hypothetical protein